MEQQPVAKRTMAQVLASESVKALGESLYLTQSQRQKATSAALRLSSDDKLKFCDYKSIVKCCFDVARYDFTRDDCVYIIPYGANVQAQIGYKGYRELALQAGYDDVDCTEVRECDTIYRDKETGQVKVSFCDDYAVAMKSKIIGYYAYAIDNGKLTNCLFWNVERIIEHGKRYSKTFNKVWGDPMTQEKMCKKTMIKQICQQLRSTPQLTGALTVDGLVYSKDGENSYADNPNNDSPKGKTTVNNVIESFDDFIETEEAVTEDAE